MAEDANSATQWETRGAHKSQGTVLVWKGTCVAPAAGSPARQLVITSVLYSTCCQTHPESVLLMTGAINVMLLRTRKEGPNIE